MNVLDKIKSVTENEKNVIANLSNITSIISNSFVELNWVGFYLFEENELVLGPFQGKVACTRIPIGKGVCGTAAETKEIQVVDNVHKFEGHIACDSESNSELVIPIIKDNIIYGVLDIDSVVYSKFDAKIVDELLTVVRYIEKEII